MLPLFFVQLRRASRMVVAIKIQKKKNCLNCDKTLRRTALKTFRFFNSRLHVKRRDEIVWTRARCFQKRNGVFKQIELRVCFYSRRTCVIKISTRVFCRIKNPYQEIGRTNDDRLLSNTSRRGRPIVRAFLTENRNEIPYGTYNKRLNNNPNDFTVITTLQIVMWLYIYMCVCTIRTIYHSNVFVNWYEIKSKPCFTVSSTIETAFWK